MAKQTYSPPFTISRFFTCWKITPWNGRVDIIIRRPVNYWKRHFSNYNEPWYKCIPWKLVQIERHW